MDVDKCDIYEREQKAEILNSKETECIDVRKRKMK